jgi:hypothetical protein
MPKPTTLSDKVEFRIREHEGDWMRRLAEQAQKAGRSVNDHARELIKIALVAEEQTLMEIQLLRQDIANLERCLSRIPFIEAGGKAIHDHLYQFRDDLLLVAIKLLVDAGHLDPQDAEAWVQETFHIPS